MRRAFLRDAMDCFKTPILKSAFWETEENSVIPVLVAPMRTDGGWSDLDWYSYHEVVGGVDGAEVALKDVFVSHSRSKYFEKLAAAIPPRARQEQAYVFLDPDSGIETPWGKATQDHVHVREVLALALMRPVSAVAVYQHQYRRKEGASLRGIAYMEDALYRLRTEHTETCGYYGGAVSMLFVGKPNVIEKIRERLAKFAGTMAEDRVR